MAKVTADDVKDSAVLDLGIDETDSRIVFRLNEGSLLSLARAEVELDADKSPLAKPAEGSRKGKLH